MKDQSVLASSLSLKKPERIMALFMLMTVGLLGYAALKDRIRQALKAHVAKVLDPKGQRSQHPTARWVWHSVVGMHWRCQAGQWPMVFNLTEGPQPLLRLLGQPYRPFDDVRYS
jgi:hypothetical protein